MKIGFLLCAYNQIEYVEQCTKPLVEFARDNDHIISCVSVPFKEYKDFNIEEDGTLDYVRSLKENGDIHYLIDEPEYISEAEARTLALKPLLRECDAIWLIDADELYKKEDYEKIINFVNRNEFVTWFKIPLKNFVGNGYLAEPFCPPRIFRRESNGFKLDSFYFDNEVVYLSDAERWTHEQMSFKSIPKSLVWVDHPCWTNCEKSRVKLDYQRLHFGERFCSYKWGENGIEFNLEHFNQFGKVVPKILDFEK